MSGGFDNGFGSTLGSDGFDNGFASTGALVTSGLVLHYDFGNSACYPGAGSSVTDLVGNSNATLSGSPTFSSGYLTFNGTNQYLITNTSLASKVPTDVTTVMMWVYPMDNGVLLSDRGSASLAAAWHNSDMELVAGTLRLGMYGPAGIAYVNSAVATPLNAWYNLAITYNGTKLDAYVNGAAAGTITFSRSNPVENGSGLHYSIAAGDLTNMGDGTYANMRLGQFLVYDSALTAAQIEQVFRSSRRTYGV